MSEEEKKLTSIIILACNQLSYTKMCIESLQRCTSEPYELILVDNGSVDGTAEYFDSLEEAKVIKNHENLGFAEGCNQGIRISKGNYILLLNNDTVVTENWLSNLIACAESDSQIGLVGPRSNYVSGLQLLEVEYESLDEMQDFARQFSVRDPAKYFDLDRLVGFCLLIKKEVIDKIGLLDEQFEIGNFEDDDYCLSARRAEYRLVCAGDTFIHHFGAKTFAGNAIDYGKQMRENQTKFLKKWYSGDEITTVQEIGMAQAALLDLKAKIGVPDPVEVFREKYLIDPWTHPETLVGTKTLSLCMIVKDEEENLPRCLKSVEKAVDEIIVVDTGSTDKSIDIAKSFGAKVFSHQWKDDFSEARNISLDNATCDWVLFLDADEELLQEDIPTLRKLLQDKKNEGYYLNEFNFLGDKPGEDIAINITFRLFRNKKEHRFSGAIHEQIVAAVQRGNPNIEFSSVRINHYGYLNRSTTDKNKIKRNLDILLEEVKKSPDDSFVLFNLGVEYLRLNKYEEAIEQYRKAFLNLSTLEVAYASVLLRNIVLCLKALKRYDEALKVLEDAKDAYPDYTDLFFLEGLIYQDMKSYSKAIQSFNSCLASGEAAKCYITQSGVGGFKAWYALGVSYQQIGSDRDAVKAFTRALKANARDNLSLLQLGMILLPREDTRETKQFLEKLVDLSSEEMLITLFSAFSMEGFYEESLVYLERAAKIGLSRSKYGFYKGESLLNLKKYSEAIDVLTKVPATSSYYYPALMDQVFCLVLSDGFTEAAQLLDLAEVCEDYKPITAVYRVLIETLKNDETSTGISIVNGQNIKTAFDWFKKLLQLREFEKFESSLPLLDKLNLSPAEKSLRLGKLYNEVGFSEMAAEELIRAHNLGLGDSESYSILGRISAEKGFLEEAKPFLSKALTLDPNKLALYASLSRILIQQNEVPEAIAIIEEGVRQFPESELLRATLDATQNLSPN